MNERLPIGTKVRTDKFGTGTVTGYEKHLKHDCICYQVTLDNPGRWGFSRYGLIPLFLRENISTKLNVSPMASIDPIEPEYQEMETKVCNKCGKEKAVTDFGKDKRNRSGLQGMCKACHKILKDNWRLNNPQRIRDWQNEYMRRPEVRERIKKYMDTRRSEYLEYHRTHSKKAYARNREKRIEWAKEWAINNPEKVDWYSAKCTLRRIIGLGSPIPDEIVKAKVTQVLLKRQIKQLRKEQQNAISN